jgi:hypothetical protein
MVAAERGEAPILGVADHRRSGKWRLYRFPAWRLDLAAAECKPGVNNTFGAARKHVRFAFAIARAGQAAGEAFAPTLPARGTRSVAGKYCVHESTGRIEPEHV